MSIAEIKTGMDLSQWEINNPVDKDQYYNCDAVIEAYLKGKKDGLKNEQKVLFNQFTENVDRSKKTTFEMLSVIEGCGFLPVGAFIKFDSFDSFHALISVSEDDFVKDDFLSIYDKAIHVENEVRDELYTLNFSFIPVSPEHFDEHIIHDGYVIRFKKK